MSLTNRTHPGKVILAQDMKGAGLPSAHAALEDNDVYPPGSTYLNTTTSIMYVKNTSNAWVLEGGVDTDT